jgi:hypothetical protein
MTVKGNGAGGGAPAGRAARTSGRHQRSGVLRFGDIARHLGFVSEAAISDALESQRARAERGENHKLLGLILLELGHIDNEQLIEILKHFSGDERRVLTA